MKHIKPYQIFESQQPEHPGFPTTEEEIHELCKKYKIKKYTINKDLSIDVDRSVILLSYSLEFLPLNFNYVSGNFNCCRNKLTSLEGSPSVVGGYFACYENQLTTLEGCPDSVGGDFKCSDNELKSLKGSPKEVGGDFNCSDNELKSLKGAPDKVGGYFDCHNNELTTLKGCPDKVGGHFSCNHNKLKTLEGVPKEVGGYFDCHYNKLTTLKNLPIGVDYQNGYTTFSDNPIYSLMNTFIKENNVEDLIFEFNEYNIVRDNKVILGRLKAFINDFDLEMPNLDEVKKHYTIV